MADILPLSQQPYISVLGAEPWGEDLTRRIGILRDIHVEKINEIIDYLGVLDGVIADQAEVLQEILSRLDKLET